MQHVAQCFAEKVRRCFVCLSDFAGSSECKDMDQSEAEQVERTQPTKTEAISVWT